MTSFFGRWRRQRVLAQHRIDDREWGAVLDQLVFLQSLSKEDQDRLKALTLLFLAEKEFTGAHDLEVTDAMRLQIAAQACLPILELGIDWYSGWHGIVVYPGDFRVRRSEVDEDGVLHEWDDELAGESMPGGPVVISWDAAAHDRQMNVVIHEFAHKLDMNNGEADGVPPLHAGMDRRAWMKTFKEAYEGFCDATEREHDTWLDPYASEHPAEFFAVLSEAFFEDPLETRRRYPDAYQQLTLFYRQDPGLRISRP